MSNREEFPEAATLRGPTSESPGIPTLAAITNAIYDAVGIRVTELPVHPARLFKALKKG